MLENKKLVTTLAFYNETYPNQNPLINAYWNKIRIKHEMDCYKYGKCEICGQEELLSEYMLTFTCDNPIIYLMNKVPIEYINNPIVIEGLKNAYLRVLKETPEYQYIPDVIKNDPEIQKARNR